MPAARGSNVDGDGSIAVRAHSGLGNSALDWDLLADTCAASPFVRPGWIAAWHETFGTGDLEIWTARRSGELVAVLPLDRHAGVLRSPTNYHTPQFELLASADDAARTLLDAAIRRTARRLDIRFLHCGDVRSAQAAARTAGALMIDRSLGPAAYVSLDGDWEAYQSSLSRNLRKSLRRCWRKLDEQGVVSVDVVRAPERVDAHLPEFFAVEAAGWKGRRGTAIASSARTRQFYGTIARWAAERGWLRLTIMRLDGRPIAVDFGIDSGRVNYSLKCGYDERFAPFSPGHLLLHSVLRSLCEEGLHGMDMLEDSQAYKQRWTSQWVHRHRVQVFPRTAAGVAEWAAWAYVRPLAKRVTALRRHGSRLLTAGRAARARA